MRLETIDRQLHEIRQLLIRAGHTIQPGPQRLATLNDLYTLASTEGVNIPQEIKA